MPPGVIRYPQPEEYFPMSCTEWKRLRSRVDALEHPMPYLGQVGWASVGLATSAVLTLIPWSAAYTELPSKAYLHYAWVSPLLTIISIGAIIIAAFCFSVNFLIRKRDLTTIKSVL